MGGNMELRCEGRERAEPQTLAQPWPSWAGCQNAVLTCCHGHGGLSGQEEGSRDQAKR